MLHVAAVQTEEIAIARELLLEYAASLEIDLAYQQFDDEVAALPGDYAAPDGQLLLGRVDGVPAGCVALRKWGLHQCEMKRLCVRPLYRGVGLGRLLVQTAIGKARDLGYREIWLDTLGTMTDAHRLYLELGFREIPPYSSTYAPGSRFYGLRLVV